MATLICNGCGSTITVPEGHTRAKLRCPECGVMCEVPATARAKGPPSKPPAKSAAAKMPVVAEDDINWDEIGPEPEPREPPKRSRPVKPAETNIRTVDNPFLKMELDDPKPPPKPAVKMPLGKGADVWPPNASQEDDGNPYGVEGGEGRKCPACQKPILDDAIICVSCGLDLRTGRQMKKEFEPMAGHWEGGWSYPIRLRWFLIGQGIAALSLVGAVLNEQILLFLGSYALFSGMTAFLLGSFDTTDLVRSKKGRVTLIKTWRICFFLQPPNHIDVRDYEGICTSKDREADFWEWFICITLLPFGLIPGVLFWYCFIHRDRFTVALQRDHGHPAMVLYRGFDENKMRDIARSVRMASGLVSEGV